MATESGTSVLGRQVLIAIAPSETFACVSLDSDSENTYRYKGTVVLEFTDLGLTLAEASEKLYWRGVAFTPIPSTGNNRQLVVFWHREGIAWTAITG